MDKCFSGHLGVSDKRRIPALWVSGHSGKRSGSHCENYGLGIPLTSHQVPFPKSVTEFRQRFQEYPGEDQELPKAPNIVLLFRKFRTSSFGANCSFLVLCKETKPLTAVVVTLHYVYFCRDQFEASKTHYSKALQSLKNCLD